MNGSRPPIRHSGESRNPGGGRGGTNHTKSLPPTGASIFLPWCPGASRHGHWYESMSRTPIRDEWFPSRPLVSSCRRPLESPRTRHSGEIMPRTPIRGTGEKITSYTVWKHIPRLHNHTLGRGSGDAGHPTDAGCSRRRRQQPEGPVQPQPAVSTPDDGSDRQQQ